MPDAFRIWILVSGPPERVYSAWMDSGAHSAFTGGEAKVDPTIGGKFTAWDGHLQGRTIELLPGRRIVQTWRAKDFPRASGDSRLEVQFEPAEGGTRVTILHSKLPDGTAERYKKGWTEQYFTPMRAYFAHLFLGPVPASYRKASRPSEAASNPKPNVASAKTTSRSPSPRKPHAPKAAPRKVPTKSAVIAKPSRKVDVKAAAKRRVPKPASRKKR